MAPAGQALAVDDHRFEGRRSPLVEGIDRLHVVVAVHEHGRCRRARRAASRRTPPGPPPVSSTVTCSRPAWRQQSGAELRRGPHVAGAGRIGGDGGDPQPGKKGAEDALSLHLPRSPPVPDRPWPATYCTGVSDSLARHVSPPPAPGCGGLWPSWWRRCWRPAEVATALGAAALGCAAALSGSSSATPAVNPGQRRPPGHRFAVRGGGALVGMPGRCRPEGLPVRHRRRCRGTRPIPAVPTIADGHRSTPGHRPQDRFAACQPGRARRRPGWTSCRPWSRAAQGPAWPRSTWSASILPAWAAPRPSPAWTAPAWPGTSIPTRRRPTAGGLRRPGGGRPHPRRRLPAAERRRAALREHRRCSPGYGCAARRPGRQPA